MKEKMRNMGIGAIGSVPWGTHLCQFYRTKEDLIDILVPYFKAGLENNEFCMWVTSEPLSEKEAKEVMRKALPHFDEFLKKGRIEIIPFNEWYIKEGAFNAKRVLKAWVDKLEKALSKNFDGMRLTGNTFWLEKENWKSFADYEEEINSVIGTYKMIAICTYHLDRCGASEIIDVVNNHQFALIRQEGKWELMESSGLKEAKDEVARSEAKYRSLVENIGQGVATVDLKGRFTYVNETLCKMIGYDEEGLLDKNFADFLHPDEKEKVFNLFCEGPKTLRRRRLHLEVRVIHKKGHVLDWYFSPTVFRHRGRILGFSTIISDITGRKKAEESLKNSAREWRATFNAVGDSVFLTDLEGRILRCNGAMGKLLGKLFSEIIGHTCRELLHSTLEPIEDCPLKRMLKSSRRQRGVLSISEHYFETTVDPVLDKGGALIGAVHIMTDVTQRKKAEEKLKRNREMLKASERSLREFSRKVLSVREEEKRKLAANLHDAVGSLAVDLSSRLGIIEREVKDSNLQGALEGLQQIKRTVKQEVRALKKIAREVRPPDLDIVGLPGALRTHFSNITKEARIKIDFSTSVDREIISDDAAIALYRTAQEALSNVINHANAKKVKVRLYSQYCTIKLNICDDGKGFDVKKFLGGTKVKGIGLRGMQERAESLNGRFTDLPP